MGKVFVQRRIPQVSQPAKQVYFVGIGSETDAVSITGLEGGFLLVGSRALALRTLPRPTGSGANFQHEVGAADAITGSSLLDIQHDQAQVAVAIQGLVQQGTQMRVRE